MESQERGGGDGTGATPEELQDLTREVLYGLVWAEPMLKVAARFKVSSSYMARICGLMNVPRPERGYWAKLTVGKEPPKPVLPEVRPGDQMIWNRSGVPQTVRRPLPRPPAARPKRKPKVVVPLSDLHPVIYGARAYFDVDRTSYDSSYLKPAKRILVDLVVSKTGLDKALSFANQLFLELEAHDCRVVIAAHGERMHREEVDEHEIPRRKPNDNYYSRLWSPGRVTVVYVGTVPIGVTIIELSEEAEARYVKGEYVRVDQETPVKRSRYANDYTWTTKKDYPTGRLCLQAYSPDWRGKWTQQWRETKDRDLTSKIRSIVKELMDAAPVIAGLIEEGERKAEIQRKQWEEERKEYTRQQAIERAAKVRRDSTDDLLGIVAGWAQAKRIEEFFADAEARLDGFDSSGKEQIRLRLNLARELLGGVDSMARFLRWKAPNERLQHEGGDDDDNGDEDED
jgi:hypothetical protein